MTSLRVRVADGEAEGLDTDGGRWQVICDTHGSIVSVESREVARMDARYAREAGACEWCEECMNEQEARGHSGRAQHPSTEGV